ncbi:MAG: hypothetical protein QHC90_26185 [Shinella sp.]|nr:hypothetical protein [Shinella sp.]
MEYTVEPGDENYKATLTPEMFRRRLASLQWSKEQLADILECDISWVNAIDDGEISAPPLLAAWLNTLAMAHDTVGIPEVYRKRKHKPQK